MPKMIPIFPHICKNFNFSSQHRLDIQKLHCKNDTIELEQKKNALK